MTSRYPRRPWTAAEVRDAIRWTSLGLTNREIAHALDRTVVAIERKFTNIGHIRKGRYRDRPQQGVNK